MAIQQRLPTGIGAFTHWTSSTGSAKNLDVDDAVGAPDDGTSYLFVQGGTGTQLFTFSAFDVVSTVIARVTVRYRSQRTVAGDTTVQALIRTGTTNRGGTSLAQTTSWADYSHDWLTNPATGAAWTDDEVNGVSGTPANNLTQFGFASGGMVAGEESQVTQVYIEVEYTPASSAKPWLYRSHTKTLGAGFGRGVN